MYQIYLDNRLIWSPYLINKNIYNPSLTMEVNKVGNAVFSVLPTAPFYNDIEKLHSIITIKRDATTIFKGRVFSDQEDFYRNKTVEVEGLLGYFNDSVVRPYEFSGSVLDYLTLLIDNHNACVTETQQFKIGNVTVTDANNYIVRASSDYPSTWQELNNKLVNLLGGYIMIRYEDDGNYIDYLADISDVSSQNIELCVNLLDLTMETDGDGISTCIIPRGAQVENTEEYVNITSVNDGLDYICDDLAVAKFGKIYEVVDWEDVTEPLNLLNKARLYLSDKIKLTTAITVKAIDLHYSDDKIEPFKLGNQIRIVSKMHNINELVMLKAYTLPLEDIANATITLNLEKRSYLNENQNAFDKRIDIVRKEIGDMVSVKTGDVYSRTETYVNDQIENSEESIKELLKETVTVTDFETYKETQSLSQTHTAESIELNFKTVQEAIENIGDETGRKIEEIQKYIRFIDGNILLGEVGNVLTTKISNGRISFLYNDSVEVAYLSDQKLYITNAEVLTTIIIGNFSFTPRGNGNLSFTKIR